MQAYTPPFPTSVAQRIAITQSLCARAHARQEASAAASQAQQQKWTRNISQYRTTRPAPAAIPPRPTGAAAVLQSRMDRINALRTVPKVVEKVKPVEKEAISPERMRMYRERMEKYYNPAVIVQSGKHVPVWQTWGGVPKPVAVSKPVVPAAKPTVKPTGTPPWKPVVKPRQVPVFASKIVTPFRVDVAPSKKVAPAEVVKKEVALPYVNPSERTTLNTTSYLATLARQRAQRKHNATKTPVDAPTAKITKAPVPTPTANITSAPVAAIAQSVLPAVTPWAFGSGASKPASKPVVSMPIVSNPVVSYPVVSNPVGSTLVLPNVSVVERPSLIDAVGNWFNSIVKSVQKRADEDRKKVAWF